MRLGFILTVNFICHGWPTPADSCAFPWKMRSTNPPRFPCVFSGKMRLAFIVPVNLHVMRPTPPGFRIFFQGKRASRQHFWIPCAFSRKTRLAFNVTVNWYDSRPTAPTFLFFFMENARRRNPATFLGFTFIVFSQVQCVLGSQVTVNAHVMIPAGCRFFFQGKTCRAGIAGKFQSWNKGILCWPKKASKRRYDLWKRMCMYQKMWFVETAGSEQTSAVIMLWAKRVCTYVVGGRVGMDDTCYFTFDLKKLDHAPPTPPTQPAPPTQPTQPIQPVFGGCMQVHKVCYHISVPY